MTSNEELVNLIRRARWQGAIVTVTFDQKAQSEEGREIISTVQIAGLKGCGPHPMSAIAAAERLRECVVPFVEDDAEPLPEQSI